MGVAKLVPTPVKGLIKKNPIFADKLAAITENADRIFDPLYLRLNSVLYRREICVDNGIKTMLSPDEREYLFKLARGTNHGSSIVEIGCYAGGSAFFLGKGAEVSGAYVYCVDPFASFKERQDSEYGLRGYFRTKPSRSSVERSLGKRGLGEIITLIEGFSQDVAGRWSYGSIGLLWIDGNHTRAALDFYAWKPHLAPEALVAFHDVTTREEVARDLAEIVGKEQAKTIAIVDSITTIALP